MVLFRKLFENHYIEVTVVIIIIIIITAVVIIVIIVIYGVTIVSNYGVTSVILLNVSPGSSQLFYRSTCQLMCFKLHFVSALFTRLYLPIAGITPLPSN